MIKISNVTHGLIPFGPSSGQRGLLIEFEESTEEIDLYDDFKKKIKSNKLEKFYLDAINGTLSEFLLFKGELFEKNDYANLWSDFIDKIGNESVNIQKTLKINNDKLRPPFCIYVGLPQEFSTTREKIGDVFQYFNVCYAVLDQKQKFNNLGLQQLINHQFSVLCIKADKDFEKYVKKELSKFNTVRKISIIDTNTQDKESNALIEKVLKTDYRYYLDLSIYENFLKF
jgi:hypothetical protein